MPSLRQPRGTRAALNALAGTSAIKPGQIYVITDENRIAVGLTTTTYETYAKESEAGGGGSSTKVTKTAIALGPMAANQTAFTYTTVPATAARGLMSQLIVESTTAGIFDLVVRGAGNDTGTLWLQGIGVIENFYSIAIPIYFENDAGQQDFFIGIKNRGQSVSTFTLNALRVEKFA